MPDSPARIRFLKPSWNIWILLVSTPISFCFSLDDLWRKWTGSGFIQLTLTGSSKCFTLIIWFTIFVFFLFLLCMIYNVNTHEAFYTLYRKMSPAQRVFADWSAFVSEEKVNELWLLFFLLYFFVKIYRWVQYGYRMVLNSVSFWDAENSKGQNWGSFY